MTGKLSYLQSMVESHARTRSCLSLEDMALIKKDVVRAWGSEEHLPNVQAFIPVLPPRIRHPGKGVRSGPASTAVPLHKETLQEREDWIDELLFRFYRPDLACTCARCFQHANMAIGTFVINIGDKSSGSRWESRQNSHPLQDVKEIVLDSPDLPLDVTGFDLNESILRLAMRAGPI